MIHCEATKTGGEEEGSFRTFFVFCVLVSLCGLSSWSVGLAGTGAADIEAWRHAKCSECLGAAVRHGSTRVRMGCS